MNEYEYIYIYDVCCFTLLLWSAGQLIFCCCCFSIICPTDSVAGLLSVCAFVRVHCNYLTFNKSSETAECVCECVVDDFVFYV